MAPQPLWHNSVAEESISSSVPLLTHEGLLLISGDPFAAYDVGTGKARWSKSDVCVPGAQLVFHGGKVFLTDAEYEGVLTARDVKTGEEVWRSRLGKDLRIEDTVAIDDENVYVMASDWSESKSATEDRTAIAAVSHTTGKKVWLQKCD